MINLKNLIDSVVKIITNLKERLFWICFFELSDVKCNFCGLNFVSRGEALCPLCERVLNIPITAKMLESQRRSFVYGNVKMSNPAVTKKMVDDAADAYPVDYVPILVKVNRGKPGIDISLLDEENK